VVCYESRDRPRIAESDKTQGNGIVEPGEQCVSEYYSSLHLHIVNILLIVVLEQDDGPNNGKKGDKCSSKCEWVDCSCGNGITELVFEALYLD
jgi:hypothetical protein